jgi:hypothetical protein
MAALAMALREAGLFDEADQMIAKEERLLSQLYGRSTPCPTSEEEYEPFVLFCHR